MPKRKGWSKIIEEHGVKVRLFERGGTMYRDVALGRTVSVNGKPRTLHDVRSLETSDRALAEQRAKALCAAIAEQRLTGASPDTVTLAQLHATYARECGPLLTRERKWDVAKAFRLFREHLGDGFKVGDLGVHQVRTYIAAREAGTLAAKGARHGGRKVRANTIAKELGVLHAALNWAELYKVNGRPLINRNPIRGVPAPSEPNPARPVASRTRYEKLTGQADIVEPKGEFRMMLDLAWYTGRRLGSIVALRASDILLSPEQVHGALAAAGLDEYLAEQWPAAIRWAAEADKEGVEWIVPIPDVLASRLGAYIRARGVVGNALLFPSRRRADKPLSKETCYYWLRQAEQRAELPHQRRGGWHAFRRAWATARKGMPLQDVMQAGGWRDPASLQRAYQHADASTVRAVMELGS